jgi:hypothetical protein
MKGLFATDCARTNEQVHGFGAFAIPFANTKNEPSSTSSSVLLQKMSQTSQVMCSSMNNSSPKLVLPYDGNGISPGQAGRFSIHHSSHFENEESLSHHGEKVISSSSFYLYFDLDYLETIYTTILRALSSSQPLSIANFSTCR